MRVSDDIVRPNLSPYDYLILIRLARVYPRRMPLMKGSRRGDKKSLMTVLAHPMIQIYVLETPCTREALVVAADLGKPRMTVKRIMRIACDHRRVVRSRTVLVSL
jgi:hypothetical protein